MRRVGGPQGAAASRGGDPAWRPGASSSHRREEAGRRRGDGASVPSGKGRPMEERVTQTFDLLLRGGTVVNHDGRGERDVGIAAGRIAAIGDLAGSSAGETVDCRG